MVEKMRMDRVCIWLVFFTVKLCDDRRIWRVHLTGCPALYRCVIGYYDIWPTVCLPVSVHFMYVLFMLQQDHTGLCVCARADEKQWRVLVLQDEDCLVITCVCVCVCACVH